MDTDVEVIKPFDDSLLKYKGLTCIGTEAQQVATGLLACEKDFPLFKEFLEMYDRMHFKKEDGTYHMVPNNCLLTMLCERYGLEKRECTQTVKDLTILPSEYFCPKNAVTKTIHITPNTYVIHYFDGSWFNEINDYKAELKRRFPFIPNKCINFMAYTKYRGFRAAIRAGKRYFQSRAYEKRMQKRK